jgi:DUF2934 family protein
LPASNGKSKIRAYKLWQQSGCKHGNDLEDWLQAQREVLEIE